MGCTARGGMHLSQRSGPFGCNHFSAALFNDVFRIENKLRRMAGRHVKDLDLMEVSGKLPGGTEGNNGTLRH
jgi:hypothetical protein